MTTNWVRAEANVPIVEKKGSHVKKEKKLEEKSKRSEENADVRLKNEKRK